MTADVTSQPELDSAVLAGLGNIPADYRHHEKLISPGPDLALPGSYLKWYDVRRPEVEIPAELAAEGRQFLAEEVAAGRLAIDGELGFVICHRCGESFYFLLVCTWRNQNEMWESVYAQDLAVGGGFALVPQDDHLEVICVWELGAVLHEQQAWSRYLRSARDEQAKRDYLCDRYRGLV
ncbi:MAG TPA: hypothetical protein VFD94_07310 [Jatrophihabitans sp.]|nr:hypothetical protein [Jatrophihabitans sp.]